MWPAPSIREFKKPRRRRRGQRRLKNELYFSYEYRDTRKSFSLFLSVKTKSGTQRKIRKRNLKS